jgi:hypothetical protein
VQLVELSFELGFGFYWVCVCVCVCVCLFFFFSDAYHHAYGSVSLLACGRGPAKN